MPFVAMVLAVWLALQAPLLAARPYSQPIAGDARVVYRLAWVVPGALLRSGAVVVDGNHLASDDPHDQTAVRSVYQALRRKYGVGAVLNLRSESAEDQAAALAAGMRFERLPIEDGHAPSPDQVERFFRFIRTARTRHEVALWHCAGGIGRTGVLAAMLRVADGWSTKDAAAEMFQMGLSYPQAQEHLPALNAFAEALHQAPYYPPDWPSGRRSAYDYRAVAPTIRRLATP
ncbi:MAG TPA: tyrosine-protein phosphatase [Stenomitos sp.]